MLPPPPENIVYLRVGQLLKWDGVLDAEEYEILYTPKEPINWQVAYSGGIATECPFLKSPGFYQAKGRTKKSGEWGDYCISYPIEVT
ncbi:MAG: hypothetical protein V1779_10965 [bacterium]